jgi:hypothetical protein
VYAQSYQRRTGEPPHPSEVTVTTPQRSRVEPQKVDHEN